MRWIKPNLRSSLHALLGSAPPSDSTLESRTEEIRQAMLEALGDNGHKLYPLITRKVRYSEGIESLWYVRGDMMAALSAMQGELRARQQVASITAMFQGMLPGGLASRPSPLTG